jgi:hypothetical protein
MVSQESEKDTGRGPDDYEKIDKKVEKEKNRTIGRSVTDGDENANRELKDRTVREARDQWTDDEGDEVFDEEKQLLQDRDEISKQLQ